MPSDDPLQRKIEYFSIWADAAFVSDAEFGLIPAPAPDLEKLPESVQAIPELKKVLVRLARCVRAQADLKNISNKAKARTEQRIASLLESLHSHEVRSALSFNLGIERHSQLLQDISETFAAKWSPDESGAGWSIVYPDISFSSTEFAEAVAYFFKRHGLRPTAGRTGAFVKTLEVIGEASGFKTNAQKAAKAALYSNPD